MFFGLHVRTHIKTQYGMVPRKHSRWPCIVWQQRNMGSIPRHIDRVFAVLDIKTKDWHSFLLIKFAKHDLRLFWSKALLCVCHLHWRQCVGCTFHAGAWTVHESCKQSLYILVVSTCARVHDFDVSTYTLEEVRNIGIHTSGFVVWLVLCTWLVQQLRNVIHEKGGEENFILIIQTPVTSYIIHVEGWLS